VTSSIDGLSEHFSVKVLEVGIVALWYCGIEEDNAASGLALLFES